MKKILTLLVLMLATVAVVATYADPTSDEAPKGVVVGEDGYQPNGSAFTWNTTIDWNTQKLVALVDVSTCTGSSEGIFSVGETIGNWSPGVHVHFYYTRATRSLEIDYLDNNNGNFVRNTSLPVEGDEFLFEISKENGFTVNGVNANYRNGGDLLTDFETEYAPYWALTDIEVGSQEGNNRSHATYKYVRVVNLPAKPVVYTDAATSVYDGESVDLTDQTVEITAEEEEGKYTVAYKQFALGSTVLGDVTATGVDGVAAEDGTVEYTFNGNATLSNVVAEGLNEGDEIAFTMTGTSVEGKLQAMFTTKYNEKKARVLYGGYEDPVEPGKEVGEDGYEPNGAAFSYDDIQIDWDKEYLEISLDLSNCSYANENVLSVGSNIADWDGYHLHFYYTGSSNTLQQNFMNSDNMSRFDNVLDSKNVVIKLSKKEGLVINGKQALYKYNGAGVTESGAEKYESVDEFLAATSGFWSLGTYSVGSTQGDTRSWAKYNYIRVKAYPVEEPTIVDTKTYTAQLITSDLEGNEKQMADKTLDINTYSDDTYGMVFHGVETANDVLGDIEIKNVSTMEDESGDYTVYMGQGTTTITDENSPMFGKEMSVYVSGVAYNDGRVSFYFEMSAVDDPDYIVIGMFETPEQTEPVTTTYSGDWSIVSPNDSFNGSVKLTDNGDGTYDIFVENYTFNDTEVGGFTVKNVPATVGEDGTVTFERGDYFVEYADATPEKPITRFYGFEGNVKGNALHLYAFYMFYQDGSSEMVAGVQCTFDGSSITDGINGINAGELNGKAEIYTIGGARVNSLQKGINIVRVNGKTMKVMKK